MMTTECCICLEPITETCEYLEVCVRCCQRYHTGCITGWWQHSSLPETCPICHDIVHIPEHILIPREIDVDDDYHHDVVIFKYRLIVFAMMFFIFLYFLWCFVLGFTS